MSICHRLGRRLSLACLVFTLPSAALANGNETELEHRGSVAAEGLSRVRKVAELHGRYNKVRDTELLGSYGLYANYTRQLEANHAWLERWYSTLELLDPNTESDFWTVQNALTKLIYEQNAGLERLSARVDSLEGQAKRARETLDRAPEISEGDLEPANVELVRVLQQHVKSIKELTTRLPAEARESLTRTRRAAGLSDSGVENLFKRFTVAKEIANGSELLAELRNYLAFEATLAPIMLQLSNLENDINKGVLFYQAYSAEEKAARGVTVCESAQATISAAQVAPGYRDHALRRVQTLCSAMQEHLATLQSMGLEKWQLLTEYHKEQRQRAAKECGGPSPQIDCTKAAVLAQTPPEEIKNMSEETRSALEKHWLKIWEKVDA